MNSAATTAQPYSITAQLDGADHSVIVVTAPTGVWTLVTHAHGWGHLVSPDGTILNADNIDTRDDTLEADVLSFIYDTI